MNAGELLRLENEVEEARNRVAGDLDLLRSPSTLSAFKNDAWGEVRASRDQFSRQMKDAVSEGAQRLFEDLKERAVANPAAALAIGAGIAWRFARKPPISSMLVGVGLISLMRTNPSQPAAGAELVSQAAEIALATKVKAEKWGSETAANVSDLSGSVGQAIRDLSSEADAALDSAAAAARASAHDARGAVARVVNDATERDKYLLGAAAIAITAALGIAYQRRLD
jgi:hypothetical protein